MASAKKCDRCGEYYDINTTFTTQMTKNTTGNFIGGVATTDIFAVRQDERFDLCDDCLDKFFKFMNGENND